MASGLAAEDAVADGELDAGSKVDVDEKESAGNAKDDKSTVLRKKTTQKTRSKSAGKTANAPRPKANSGPAPRPSSQNMLL